MKIGIYYLYDRADNFLGEIYAFSAEDAIDEAYIQTGIDAHYAVFAQERNL